MKIYKKVVSNGFASSVVLGTFSTVGLLATALEVEAQCPKIQHNEENMTPVSFCGKMGSGIEKKV